MSDVKRGRVAVAVLTAILSVAAAGLAHGADQTAAGTKPAPTPAEADKLKADQGHMLMDHSRGDPKSMNMMKDKIVPVHHEGDAPAVDDSVNCKEHVMMDHSVGDQKSMNLMKDKKVPLHKGCKPAALATKPGKPVDHVMMDHSMGDPKSMSMMKDKKIPIHHGSEAEKPSAESAPK